MHTLEKKIPPPLVGLLIAALMWGLAAWPPADLLPSGIRVPLAAALAVAGVGFDVLGLVAFRRHRTTVNPLRPERASALVTCGVYRITRNPMYVGLALLLTAWAVHLSALWAFGGPVMFVAYINRFQIAPEERVLEAKFSEYRAYATRVRRWL
jgi:protein-S-isoprenylcysteine O-methyltransferase Ste14